MSPCNACGCNCTPPMATCWTPPLAASLSNLQSVYKPHTPISMTIWSKFFKFDMCSSYRGHTHESSVIHDQKWIHQFEWLPVRSLDSTQIAAATAPKRNPSSLSLDSAVASRQRLQVRNPGAQKICDNEWQSLNVLDKNHLDISRYCHYGSCKHNIYCVTRHFSTRISVMPPWIHVILRCWWR